MNKDYIISETQLKRIIEEIEEPKDLSPDFNKTVFNPEDKSIVGAYMITKDFPNMIEVLNIHEVLDNSGLFMDGAESYNINIKFSKLPKSQIEIIGDVPGKDGFVFIKMPYWLYKKNPESLSIKRYLGKKRLSISRSQVYGDYLKLINDPNVERYFKVIDTDEASQQRFKSYQRHYKPKENN